MIQKQVKGKPFNCDMDPDKICLWNSSNSENSDREDKTLTESSSELERKVNALASGADEGRDKLR